LNSKDTKSYSPTAVPGFLRKLDGGMAFTWPDRISLSRRLATLAQSASISAVGGLSVRSRESITRILSSTGRDSASSMSSFIPCIRHLNFSAGNRGRAVRKRPPRPSFIFSPHGGSCEIPSITPTLTLPREGGGLGRGEIALRPIVWQRPSEPWGLTLRCEVFPASIEPLSDSPNPPPSPPSHRKPPFPLPGGKRRPGSRCTTPGKGRGYGSGIGGRFRDASGWPAPLSTGGSRARFDPHLSSTPQVRPGEQRSPASPGA